MWHLFAVVHFLLFNYDARYLKGIVAVKMPIVITILCFLHISKEVYLMSLICQFCHNIQPPLKNYNISTTGVVLKQILL